MCTGAEIPALLAGTAAAGTAAGTGAAATGAGLGTAAGIDALSMAGGGLAGAEGLGAGAGLLGASDAAGLGGLGAGAADYGGELASVGETHSPAYWAMGGNSVGGPNTGAMSLWDGLSSKANTTRTGMNLLNQSMQPRTPQPGAAQRPPGMGQQQPGPSPQFAGTQPMGQPMTPGTAGSMMTHGVQSTGGAADILKRLGLLGGY
jgi:hypothetical protein